MEQVIIKGFIIPMFMDTIRISWGRVLSWFAVVLGLALLLLYAGTLPHPLEEQTPRPHDHVEETESTLNREGAKLFLTNCAICHLNGVGGAPKPAKMKLDIDVVKSGRNVMPSFSHLTDEEIKQIFNYIKKFK